MFCSVLTVVPYVDTIVLIVTQKVELHLLPMGKKDLVKGKVHLALDHFFLNELTSIYCYGILRESQLVL